MAKSENALNGDWRSTFVAADLSSQRDALADLNAIHDSANTPSGRLPIVGHVEFQFRRKKVGMFHIGGGSASSVLGHNRIQGHGGDEDSQFVNYVRLLLQHPIPKFALVLGKLFLPSLIHLLQTGL